MKIVDSVGPGNYNFRWDGGAAFWTFYTAASWGGDGRADVVFIAEDGQQYQPEDTPGGITSNHQTNSQSLPPGDYQLQVSGTTISGLIVTVARCPA